MAWITPKTDWKSTDYFNASDYNRIIGNITHLKAHFDALFINLTNVSLGEDKAVLSLIYAREMNAIETALETLNLETYRFNIGEKAEYETNKATPLWTEFNRIESAILKLYDMMIVHERNRTRLAFTLGNQKGLRV